MTTDRLVPLATQLLTLNVGEGRTESWLWEHTERVLHLTQAIAALPAVDSQRPDHEALVAAALFHDAGWAVEYQQGRWQPAQLLTRPTNDIQRELGAAQLLEEVGALLPKPTLRLAAEAIRQCNERQTELIEARVLADAEALDELSAVYVLRQFRQYQAEGRPLEQLVQSWDRQQEYRYWDLRLNDGFHFDTTQNLARQRLAAIDAYVAALRSALRGDDVREILQATPVARDDTP